MSPKSQPPTEANNDNQIRTSSGQKSEVTKASNPLSDPTLHEDIYTLPNILTFSRLVAAPFIGYFVLHDSHAWAAGLLAYAGVTDLLDGWIARRWNRQTVVGTVIDPMADKVLMTVLTVCLAVKGALPGMSAKHLPLCWTRGRFTWRSEESSDTDNVRK